MTNSQTIIKLNDALTKLITQYKKLQTTNNNFEEKLKQKDIKIKELEEKISNLSGNSEVNTTKINDMLNKIESTLDSKETITIKNEEDILNNNIFEDEDIDLKIGGNDFSNEEDNFDIKANASRVESLLNGLNNK